MKEVLLAITVVLLSGCSTGYLEQPEAEDIVKYEENEINQAEQDFVEFMEFNYSMTEWFHHLKGYGITTRSDGAIILGVQVDDPEAYKKFRTAVNWWVTGESEILIDYVWYLHGEKNIHSDRFDNNILQQ